MDSDALPSGLDPVDELAEEYLRRRRRGEHPTPAEYAARYPEHAGRILELFPGPRADRGAQAHAGGSRRPVGRVGRGGAIGRRRSPPAAAGRLHPAPRARPRRHGDRLRGRARVAQEPHGARRSCTRGSVPTATTCGDFRPRPARRRSCTTPTSCRSSTTASRTASATTRCNASWASGWSGCWRTSAASAAAANHDTGAGTGGVGQGTVIDAGADPLAAISRGLLTGRFADAPTASLAAGSDSAAIEAARRRDFRLAPGPPDRPPPHPAVKMGRPAARSPANPSRSISARSHASVPRSPTRWTTPTARGSSTATSSPPTSCSTPEGTSGSPTSDWPRSSRGTTCRSRTTWSGPCGSWPPSGSGASPNPLGDVYSLGATLYELLTLKPAFAERDQARLIDQITHEPPAPLRQHDRRIPRDLETLVLKALAKDPKDRFASAAELRDELRRYLESRPIRSRPVGPVERLWRWCRRSPGLAAASIGAAVLAMILLIGSIFAAWTFRRDNPIQGRSQDARKPVRFPHGPGAGPAVQPAGRPAIREPGRPGPGGRDRAGAETASRDSFDRLRDEAIACLALPDLKETGRVIHRPAGSHLAPPSTPQ